MTFKKGWHPNHDVSNAGRKAATKPTHPWHKGFSPNSSAMWAKLVKAGKRQ
jgi:hypothetical protein